MYQVLVYMVCALERTFHKEHNSNPLHSFLSQEFWCQNCPLKSLVQHTCWSTLVDVIVCYLMETHHYMTFVRQGEIVSKLNVQMTKNRTHQFRVQNFRRLEPNGFILKYTICVFESRLNHTRSIPTHQTHHNTNQLPVNVHKKVS